MCIISFLVFGNDVVGENEMEPQTLFILSTHFMMKSKKTYYMRFVKINPYTKCYDKIIKWFID